MQNNEFSPFYSREYHNKRNVSEERQIFRWFQLLEQRCLVYNVKNKHDCLRENREEKERARLACVQARPIVVQPFHSVANFYGCLVCGKYHICGLRHENCIIVIDMVDKRQSCGYSGQLLPIQDDLVVGNFDDDRRTDTESSYYVLPDYMRTNNNAAATKRLHTTSKKSHKRHVMTLFSDKEAISPMEPLFKRARSSSVSKKEDYQRLVSDVYDLSLESLSEEEHENATEIAEEDDEEDDDDTEEDNTPIETPISVEKNPDEVTKECDGCGEMAQEDEDSYGDERYDAQENENGEGSHAKNYHNNIRYKNEYYSFLEPVIAKAKTKRREADRYKEFIDLYKRDMKEEEEGEARPAVHNEEDEENVVVTEKKLGIDVCNKIDEEVELIIGVLLKIDLHKRAMKEEEERKARQAVHNEEDDETVVVTEKKPGCKVKPSRLHKILTAYYAALVRNITLLLYQSPVLNKIALKRSTKNQNQGAKFTVSTIDMKSVSNIQSDVDYHQNTLCPAKIARALILRLFVEPFSITINGYRIQIWGRDQWLRTFTRLPYSYHGEHDIQRFEKECNDTATLILDCLAHYNMCPLWLRDMVFKDVI